jgi:hypothetical protein
MIVAIAMISVLAASLATFGVAFAPGEPSPKAYLTGVYAKLNSLILKRDVPAIQSLFRTTSTKDFRYVDLHKKSITGPQLMAQMKAQMAMTTKVDRSTMKIAKVTVTDSKAVLLVDSAYSMSTIDADQKSHTLTGTMRSEDTWVKQGKEWKLQRIQSVREKATMDGKPIPIG